MPPAPEQPAVGQLKLELLAEIAVGATTRVDLCRSRGPAAKGELLAVKRLLPELREDPIASKRFLDEVWMTSALRHPNVVRVIGWGNDEQGSYLAVELVQGVSLARLMKTVFDTGEDFTERLAVYLGLCAARGLGAAHDLRSDRGEPLSLVHRNLTPSNVLLGFSGDVKVADFGLAKAKQRLSTTTASSLPSRPSTHVSPEEIRGDRTDHRGDLFSLGVILFEVLTRKLPWTGGSDLEIVQRIVREPPPDPASLRPKLDRSLTALVLRCLEKDPDARFATAHEVVRELEGWLYAHGWSEENEVALARFVRRNAMRQMHWFERAIAGGARPGTQRPPPSFRSSGGEQRPAATADASRPRPAEKSRAEITQVERPARRRRADSSPPDGRFGPATTPTSAPAKAAPPREAAPPADEPFADPPTLFEEDSEEVPTLAMRRSELPPEFFARLARASAPGATGPGARGSAAKGPPSQEQPAQRPPSKGPPPLPTREPGAQLPLDASGAPPATRSDPPRPRPAPPPPPGKATVQAMAAVPSEWSRAIDRIKLELETHRTAAASMRESAQQLIAAAEDEEAAGLRAERALAMAKEAAALANGGAVAEARARLEEALRLAHVSR